MNFLKPMLACDWDESKLKKAFASNRTLRFYAQPKVDGVRGTKLGAGFTGRSLKPHANKFITEQLSPPQYSGIDCELYVGGITDSDLCRNITSAVNRVHGEPDFRCSVFDYVTEDSVRYTYDDRLKLAQDWLDRVADSRLHLTTSIEVQSFEEIEALDLEWTRMGYEGSILRACNGMHKSGRATANEMGLMRIKRFVQEDAVVLRIVEGQSNQNEATTNALGRTERSTHQENMVPNGLVGSLICLEVKTGLTIEVSAGAMSHAERRHYFLNPNEIVGKVISFKHFPVGRKDLPRFPTFVCVRADSDLV